VVAIVWIVAGLGLGVARLHIGEAGAWTSRESEALAHVREYSPDDVHSCDELLAVAAERLSERDAGSAPVARWYAFERPWEGRVYVVWERGEAMLGFVVEDGDVKPDDETRLVLKRVARSLGTE